MGSCAVVDILKFLWFSFTPLAFAANNRMHVLCWFQSACLDTSCIGDTSLCVRTCEHF